jgi:hypothetical protein
MKSAGHANSLARPVWQAQWNHGATTSALQQAALLLDVSQAFHDIGHVSVFTLRHLLEDVHHLLVGFVAGRMIDQIFLAGRKVDAFEMAAHIDRRLSTFRHLSVSLSMRFPLTKAAGAVLFMETSRTNERFLPATGAALAPLQDVAATLSPV